jgi:hypothetical protein
MGDHNSPLGGARARPRAELLQEGFMGQPVEAVAHDTLLGELAGQRVHPCNRGHLPMEGRVEAGNVQQLGKRILNHSHRPNLRREMPGIQLPDLAKLLLDHGRYHHGLGEAAAAMDNPMADSIDAVAE